MLIPGEVFGSYQIVREIGRGGMGAVYEAEHIHLRKRVAVKVLLPDRAMDATTAQRFVREGEAASRIRHDHVVDVIDVGVEGGTVFLVMELLEGESLADRIDRVGRLCCEEIADIFIPLIDALATAHEVGVIHRDIKPENVILSRGRRGRLVPKLVDFGISRIETPADPEVVRLTSSMVLVGTPCYMAPEAARGGRNADARSDQYALGVMLYECVTGTLPFNRTSVFEMLSAILTERPTDPGLLVPSLDPRMETIIQKAMAREPEDRFADVRALGCAILPLASAACRAQWAAEFAGEGDDDVLHPSLLATAPQPAARKASAQTPVTVVESAPDQVYATLDERITPVSLPSRAPAAPSSRPSLVAVGAALVVAALLSAVAFRGHPDSPAATVSAHSAASDGSLIARASGNSFRAPAAPAVATTPPSLQQARVAPSAPAQPEAFVQPVVPVEPAQPAVPAPPPGVGAVRRAVAHEARGHRPAVAANAALTEPAIERPAAPTRTGAQSMLREDFDPGAH